MGKVPLIDGYCGRSDACIRAPLDQTRLRERLSATRPCRTISRRNLPPERAGVAPQPEGPLTVRDRGDRQRTRPATGTLWTRGRGQPCLVPLETLITRPCRRAARKRADRVYSRVVVPGPFRGPSLAPMLNQEVRVHGTLPFDVDRASRLELIRAAQPFVDRRRALDRVRNA